VAFGYYTGKFTDDVYPIVPEQFGGGRPIDVGIVLSPAGSEALRALQPTANRTSYEGAQIVFEGEDYYIIRLPSDVVPSASRLVFRIPKSAVQVVSSVARLR